MLKDFAKNIGYDDPLEVSLSRIEALLLAEYKISKRAVALLCLQEDKGLTAEVASKEKDRINEILKIIEETKAHYSNPLTYIISVMQRTAYLGGYGLATGKDGSASACPFFGLARASRERNFVPFPDAFC